MNPSSQWVFPSTRRPISDPAIRRALGPLAVLSDDQAITDIFVTSDGRAFADRGSGAVGVTGLHLGQSESTNLARGLIEEGGRHLDEASPMVDVRLAEGMRVHAVLPPVAVGGPTMSIRFSRQAMVAVDDLAMQWTDQQRERVLSAVSDVSMGVVSDQPCDVARAVAKRQGNYSVYCVMDGSEARVTISAEHAGITLSRTAKAGPPVRDPWNGVESTP